jgi:hypothetical protein
LEPDSDTEVGDMLARAGESDDHDQHVEEKEEDVVMISC